MTGLRLTRRGAFLAAAVPLLLAAGRVLGAVELHMLALSVVTLLLVASVRVALSRPVVAARRTFHPSRLAAGAPGAARIEIHNRGAWPSPVLQIEDAFAARRSGRATVPPIPARGRARAGYRVPTERRGIFPVGPLRVSVTDPFGLAARLVSEQPVTDVTVYPRVHRVPAPPPATGQDLSSGAAGRVAQTRSSHEFHALREYAIGDDLRRIHWRSTARNRRLMVREDEVPWQMRATVLLDTASSRFSGASFEVAVESAASVVSALHRSSALLRFLESSDTRTTSGAGHEHADRIMETLAAVETEAGEPLAPLVGLLRREPGGGALVAVVGEVDDEEIGMLATLGRRFPVVVVLRHLRRPAGDAPDQAAPRRAGRGVAVVDVSPHADLGVPWSAALAVASHGHPGRTRRSWQPA